MKVVDVGRIVHVATISASAISLSSPDWYISIMMSQPPTNCVRPGAEAWLSGAVELPKLDWRRAAEFGAGSNVWATEVPVGAFGDQPQLRVAGRRGTRARYPNGEAEAQSAPSPASRKEDERDTGAAAHGHGGSRQG